MSNEQRWIASDALGLLLQISRVCCLAPVRFVVISTETFVYISRSFFLFNLIVVTIIHLLTIYRLYLWIYFAKRENYSYILLEILHISIIILFVSIAVLKGDCRMRHYMMYFTNLKRIIKTLHNTETTNIRKWHVLIIFIVSSGGINIVLIFNSLMSPKSFNFFTFLLMLEYNMAGIYQQQFVFFALHINFALKLIQEKLQEELAKLIDDDENECGELATTRFNIPLESINKAVDMIGRTDIYLPSVRQSRRHDIALRIRQITDCFVSTCDALRDLNMSDNVLLFFQIIYVSLSMVLSLYDIINLIRQDEALLQLNIPLHCLQLGVLLIQIIMLVEPCHVALEKIAKIRLVVCEIMCYVSSEDDPILIEMRAFFNQLVLTNISYTALGIFNIGRPLIPSIIGGVTTALILIFEF